MNSTTNPLANPSPMTVCDHCGSPDYRDVHTGDYTVRRECSRCSRFMGWPRWRDLDLTDAPEPKGYQREAQRGGKLRDASGGGTTEADVTIVVVV